MRNFYKSDFGWICKHCESDLKIAKPSDKHSRLMSEGEAESKTPTFSTSALAKWADETRQTLICPRCEIKEKIIF